MHLLPDLHWMKTPFSIVKKDPAVKIVDKLITEDSHLMTETPVFSASPLLIEINSLIQIRNYADYFELLTIKNQVLKKTMHFHRLLLITFSLQLLSVMRTTDLFRLYADCSFCEKNKGKNEKTDICFFIYFETVNFLIIISLCIPKVQ